MVEGSLAGADPAGLRFTWTTTRPADPVTLIVLAADYSELARRAGVVGTEWRPDASLRTQLEPGATYHCLVRSESCAVPTQSSLATFVIR